MKVALITTTIFVPTVLALYRKLGPDVMFFIAGDRKTPDVAVTDFLHDIPNHAYYGIDHQHKLGYKCSRLIGENCIQRRNIALLEAARWGADVIVSIDDDNIPMHWPRYFHDMQECFIEESVFNGLAVSSPTGWFDPGSLLIPHAKHRGFPISIKAESCYAPVTDARIGVAAGLCLGDPDIDAVTRIATNLIVHSVSELGRAGVVVDPRQTKTVFNSQNTAFIRELAPAMFMLPGTGRYDDIFASLICQRVMREKAQHVHFGQPFIWQQRNKHNLVNDLKAEMLGMEHVEEFAVWLDSMEFALGQTVLDMVRAIYGALGVDGPAWMPGQAIEAGLAFCEDCKGLGL